MEQREGQKWNVIGWSWPPQLWVNLHSLNTAYRDTRMDTSPDVIWSTWKFNMNTRCLLSTNTDCRLNNTHSFNSMSEIEPCSQMNSRARAHTCGSCLDTYSNRTAMNFEVEKNCYRIITKWKNMNNSDVEQFSHCFSFACPQERIENLCSVSVCAERCAIGPNGFVCPHTIYL